MLQQRGTKYEADIERLKVAIYEARGEYPAAVAAGERAKAVLASLGPASKSEEDYQMFLDIGRSYAALGEHLKACLNFQENFVGTDSSETAKAFSRSSKGFWKESWYELYKANDFEKPAAENLCPCEDIINSFARPEPVRRIPPLFPDASMRNGISGEVIVLFDVLEDGTTTNVRTAAYTDKMFKAGSVRAARAFIYTPALRGADMTERTDVPTKFRFTMMDGENRPIPAPAMKTIIPLSAEQMKQADRDEISITGSRTRVR